MKVEFLDAHGGESETKNDCEQKQTEGMMWIRKKKGYSIVDQRIVRATKELGKTGTFTLVTDEVL